MIFKLHKEFNMVRRKIIPIGIQNMYRPLGTLQKYNRPIIEHIFYSGKNKLVTKHNESSKNAKAGPCVWFVDIKIE